MNRCWHVARLAGAIPDLLDALYALVRPPETDLLPLRCIYSPGYSGVVGVAGCVLSSKESG